MCRGNLQGSFVGNHGLMWRATWPTLYQEYVGNTYGKWCWRSEEISVVTVVQTCLNTCSISVHILDIQRKLCIWDLPIIINNPSSSSSCIHCPAFWSPKLLWGVYHAVLFKSYSHWLDIQISHFVCLNAIFQYVAFGWDRPQVVRDLYSTYCYCFRKMGCELQAFSQSHKPWPVRETFHWSSRMAAHFKIA